MSEMIERAAKAIYEHEQACRGSDTSFNQILFGRKDAPPWEYLASAEVWPAIAERYRALAKCVIGAMREPTELMIESAFSGTSFASASQDEIRNGWRAMIDAALSSEKE